MRTRQAGPLSHYVKRGPVVPLKEVPHENGSTSLLVRNLPVRDAIAEGGPLNSATLAALNPETRSSQGTSTRGLQRVVQCAQIAEDNKAKDIVVLDMRDITPLYDFLILATGSSRRQIHTITEEIDAFMRTEGEKRLSVDGYTSSRWVVQDYGDVVVHVFDPESRQYYALEELWADAPHLDWQRV